MPKEYSVSFRSKAVGMVHGGMSPKRVCEQLSIGRSQLFIWRKREKLGQDSVTSRAGSQTLDPSGNQESNSHGDRKTASVNAEAVSAANTAWLPHLPLDRPSLPSRKPWG